MTPKVSIIIPCYNDGEFIEKAIISASDQTYGNKELIVIDDGSDKRTKEILNSLALKIDKLITQDNQGVIVSRNNAIKLAKGQYILTLDADDYFEPAFLEKAVKILESNQNVGMVTCWFSVINEKGEQTRISKPTGASAFKTLFKNNAPASLLYRKQCWEEVKGYDENLKKGYEDWEFNIAVGKKGWKVHVIPEILFIYRNRKASRNKQARNFYTEIRKYTYKKHKELLVKNIDQSIELFINESASKQKRIKELRNSRSYLTGELFTKPLRKLRSLFFNK